MMGTVARVEARHSISAAIVLRASLDGGVHLLACVWGLRDKVCVSINVVKIDLDVDTDRNGTVDAEADDDKEDEFSRQRGAVVLFNSDDDNDDDARDCEDGVVQDGGDSDDLAKLVIQPTKPPPDGAYPRLKVPKALATRARIFDSAAAGGTELLGPDTGLAVGEYKYSVQLSLDWLVDGHELGVEALSPMVGAATASDVAFDGAVKITLALLRYEGAGTWDYANPLASDTVRLQVAPFIVAWNGQEAEQLYMDDRHGVISPEIDDEIGRWVDIDWSEEPYVEGRECWYQDFAEIVNAESPKTRMKYIVDLDHADTTGWPEELRCRQHQYGDWKALNAGNGGNIEATPPLPDYPLGRLVIGDGSAQRRGTAFFEAQKVQSPMLVLPTKWLRVKHVDEVVSFVPKRSSAAALLPSPAVAIDILDALLASGQAESASISVGTSYDDEACISARELLVMHDQAGSPQISQLDLSMGDYEQDDFMSLAQPLSLRRDDILRVGKEYMTVTYPSSTTRRPTRDVSVSRGALGTGIAEHGEGDAVYVLSELARSNLAGKFDWTPVQRKTYGVPQTELDVAAGLVKDATDFEIIRLPVLFKRGITGWEAYTSNVVNCLVVQTPPRWYSSHFAFMQSTRGPNANGVDHFQAYITNRVGLRTHTFPIFLEDGWYLHLAGGEIHCATNARREPLQDASWWDAWPAQ